MTVTFFGDISRFTNAESLTFDQVSNLQHLIDTLGADYGGDFKDYLLADGTVFFLVNGRSILSTGGLKTPLEQDSVVNVLPHVEAG